MNADDYGKMTYIIMNQQGITAQSKLELIYKSSLLLDDKSWYMGENPKVVLTQEKTIVETKPQEQHDDYMQRMNQQQPQQSQPQQTPQNY